MFRIVVALNNFRGLILFGVGELVVKSITMFTGLIMVARYINCDPYTTKIVKQRDQMLPYFVLDVAGHIPGLPGLFIAGIFSASLRFVAFCRMITKDLGVIFQHVIGMFECTSRYDLRRFHFGLHAQNR